MSGIMKQVFEKSALSNTVFGELVDSRPGNRKKNTSADASPYSDKRKPETMLNRPRGGGLG